MKPEENMSKKYGVLNCPPTEDNDIAKICFKRVECNYTDLSEVYRKQTKDFTKQFAHIYAIRLNSMRDSLKLRAANKWGSDVKMCRLVELQDAGGERCVIIGTLFLDQKLKPSILKEISEEAQLAPQPVRTNFVSDNDTLILEDELQRITLQGALDVHKVVTGVVCAVLGHEDTDTGKFLVEDYCWAGVDSVPVSVAPPDTDQFIVLLSGLELVSNVRLLQTHLMVEWLSGFLGEPTDQEKASKVVRVIIAGNSVRCDEDKGTKTTGIHSADSSLSAVQLLDDFLHQLVQFIDVDLMPGEFDPTNHTLPQQPLHFCMFPKASQYQSLNGVTNPYSCLVNGRRITGTAGQPIADIARYSQLTEPVEILEQTLQWGHLSPTSPDTLPCYPFYERDPFILEAAPDIYFTGNQQAFQSRMVNCPDVNGEAHQVQLVCVPSFAKTSTCAIINLSSLECYPMSFGIALE